ncbi:MAG TPA: DUF3426 domain-containing protein [Steroidobacteraceae bacterium]
MFTLCPKCTLTLAVTANDLRMGQGYVRCGRCANVFNALLTLSEEPEESDPAPVATQADRASSSQIQAALRDAAAQTGADQEAASVVHAPGSEASAQAEPADGPPLHLATEQSSDGSIENESSFAEGTGTFETIVLEGEGITQIEEYVPEASVDSEMAALAQRLERVSNEPLVSPPPDLKANGGTALDVDNDADADADADGIQTSLQAASTPRAPRARWPWIAGGAALLLLLALQVVNHWRDALAASAPLSAPLSRAYAALGLPLDPHWDLAAYDVRQQGAVVDPSDGQVIRVRLSLANHAERAQPLPLLHLTLLDRYGKRLAASELTPEQYSPAGAPPRAYLGRDERIDTEIAIRDPSAASASFELDVCLRGRSGGLRCAGDAPAHGPP